METRTQFRQRVQQILNEIGQETFEYDRSEYWMIQAAYEYVEFYATDKRLINTAIALPLARGLHNGVHRKSSIVKEGVSYRLPYLIHPLMVCRMLIHLQLPIPSEEEDIILASALCHDMIEDIPFPDHGKELYTRYFLDPRVYDTVKLVSKRKDFTPEEELAHFHGIESNKFALLVKLADRGNNVEDLYNMSVWKVHEYAGETRKFFLPMCEYGIQHYPQILGAIEILQDKMIVLTSAAEILVDRYEQRSKTLRKQAEELRQENRQLRAIWHSMWGE